MMTPERLAADPRAEIKAGADGYRVVFRDSDSDWPFPSRVAAEAFLSETLERWDRVAADEAAGKPFDEGPEEPTKPDPDADPFAGVRWLGI